MSGGQTANPFFEALKFRRRLALHVFLGVMLIVGAGVFMTLQYSASAVVALDPRSLSPADQARSPVELAWAALTDDKIQAIIQQFGLNSGITRLRAQSQVFNYVRSNIVLHELDSGGSGAPTVQVSFVGPAPATVIGATNAIAQTLAQPSTPPKQQPGTVAPSNTPSNPPNNPPANAVDNAPANPPNNPPTNTANGAANNTPTNTQANTANNISEELEKSRATLQLLSQAQNASVPQSQLQKYFRTDTDLQSQRRDTVVELSALDQQKAQAALVASRERARAQAEAEKPPAPNPEAVQLEQEIQVAQARLAELRQRYTDNYPDVEIARETVANLEVRLSQIPAPKPRPKPQVQSGPSPDEIRINAEEAQVLARQQGLDEAIQNNQKQAAALRRRIADSKNFAQDYAFEQQRYNTLLQEQRQQQQQPQSQPQQAQQQPAQPQQQQPQPRPSEAEGNGLNDAGTPRFIIIQSATSASAGGIALQPPFWIASALFALLVACLSAFVAEQFNPAAGNDVTPRSLHTS